jgi:uncharacterized protein YjiS (DUF1127 family)
MKPLETIIVCEAARSESRSAVANGWNLLRRWYKARQTYKTLSMLDDRALKDIGIFRSERRYHSRRQ